MTTAADINQFNISFAPATNLKAKIPQTKGTAHNSQSKPVLIL
ncbi:hypothetical protein [Hoylesella timonensis]|nr:hypothetical protein [Hoylesella timonensis]